MEKFLEPDTATRALRITAAFNDVLYSAANEPSLGMYRIQEHVAVTVPKLVEQQLQLQDNSQRVEGASYDLEYDTKTLRDMAGITQFRGIKNSLLRAIQLKQQLDENRRMAHTPQTTPNTSMAIAINSGDSVDGNNDIITSIKNTTRETTEPQLSPKTFD